MVDRAQLTAWMRAAAEGDRGAIDPLFHTLWPLSVAYATRLLAGDRALAEDCAQTALTRMMGQLERFDPSGDALTWTLSHLTWECRTARKTRLRRAEQPVAEAPESIVDGRDVTEHRDLVRAALRTLEELSPLDAETLAVTLSSDETVHSSVLPATFRKRLERASLRLRAAWRARHGAR